MTVITLSDETTWPNDLVECLDKHQEILYSWEAANAGISDAGPAARYDEAHEDIRQLLNSFFLLGYHCTKLTQNEIAEVQGHGMSLQNLQTLSVRIDRLIQDGLLTSEMAHELKHKNQANDRNRQHMLWFCFSPPHYAGQNGIERFFRFWGGEALYNSHENNATTAAVLKRLGIPCVIEATVSIEFLPKYCYLTNKIARVYLKNRGLNTNECCNLESYATKAIPANNIRRIIKYPEMDFINLTKCESWDQKLPAFDI